MSTPAVTLTANLQDLTGSAVGSAANPAKLCIALCGYGPQLPRIGGTAMIARPGPMYIESTNGTISVKLWGNDVIVPAGTYYSVAILDGGGNVVQCSAYILTGSGTYDLSQAPPVTYPGQVFTEPPGMQTWNQNVIAPATSYTLPATPTPLAPFMLFRSGMLLNQGNPPFGKYTLNGNLITFTDSGTEIGDTLYAIYWSS